MGAINKKSNQRVTLSSGYYAVIKKEYYKNGNPLKGDSKDIEGYIKDADRQNGAEFVYLYNIKDKKWYYADTYKDTKLKKLF